MTEDKTKNPRLVPGDLDRLLKETWSKVVEYASIGAEEASRMSAAAKIRVDIETLRYRRGRLLKTLGERYFRSCGQDPDKGVDGTRETMRQIVGLDRDITELEGDLSEMKGKKQTPAKPLELPQQMEPPDQQPTTQTTSGTRRKTTGRRPASRTPSS